MENMIDDTLIWHISASDACASGQLVSSKLLEELSGTI